MASPPGALRDPSSARQVDTSTFNSRIMIVAMVILFAVVLFVVSLHIYAKWFWQHGSAASRWSAAHALHASRDRRRRRLELVTDESMVPNPSAGLDPSTVDSLPTFVYQGAMLEAEPLLECAVCLSEFQVEDHGRILPNCKHSFHIDCIDTWFRSRSTCPLCRTPVLSTATTNGELAENTSNHSPPSLQYTVSSTTQHADEQDTSAARAFALLQNAVVSADPHEPILLQNMARLELHLRQAEGAIANNAGVAPPLQLPSPSASVSCAHIPPYGEFLCKDDTAQTASGSSSARAAIARSASLTSLSMPRSEEAQECSLQPQKSLSFRISIKRLVSRELSKGRSRVFPSGQVNAQLEQSVSDMNLPV